MRYLQTSVVGGEISPRLEGRSDVSKFGVSARVIENGIVLAHGGVKKRSGTRFVVEQKSATDDVVLVPFQYNVEQAYMLMFGPGYVWFFRNKGIITHAPVSISGITQASQGVVTTATPHGLTTGQNVILNGIGGMVELNNRRFVIAVLSPTTLRLTGIATTDYEAYVSGGQVHAIVELATDYEAAQVPELTFTQTNDTLYIAHKAHPLRKIARASHTSWTLETPRITTGPFRTINADRNNKITASNFSAGATGYGTHIVGTQFTMSAQKDTFDTGMVGALFRLNEEGGGTGIMGAPIGDETASIAADQMYTFGGLVYGVFQVSGASNWSSFTRVPDHDSGTVRVNGKSGHYFDADFLHPGYCIVKVLGYNSPLEVTAEIVRYQMPQSIVSSGTTFWEEGAWSDRRGFPGAIALYENRMFLAGSLSEPATIWGSKAGAYEDFADGTQDNDALVYRVGSGVADAIRWLAAGRVLTAGTSSGEYAIAASVQNEALTPSNFKVVPQTSYGTSATPPVRVDQSVLYPQRNGAPSNASIRLREFAYEFQRDSFNSIDLSVFAEHIFGRAGFDRIAYLLQPNALIYCRRTDGQLASCTYERTQEVVAWHRQVLGGEGAQVMTVGAIPGDDGDELWLSVRRSLAESGRRVTEDGRSRTTEDGFARVVDDEAAETVRYIEVLEAPFEDTDDKEDGFFVDSGATYTGPATSTLSGLWHLRGQEVRILNNGAVETATVTPMGRITLQRPTTKAHVGLSYKLTLETQDFDTQLRDGTAQGRAKRMSDVHLRLLNALGGTYGTSSVDQIPILYRKASTPMDASPPLYSGLKTVTMPSGWETTARVRIEHDDPLPMHITGLVVELSVS